MTDSPKPLPDFEVMYAAMLARDPGFDGIFFVCVRTTGVFCRPTCRARNPLRATVEFVGTTAEAQRSGYRPCRRCQPLEPSEAHPHWARQLLSRIGESEERLTDATLGNLGLDPRRVRGYFRRRFGMTFHAFQRSQRLGRALKRLNEGSDTLSIGFDSGYESASGFRDAFVAAFGCPPGRAAGLRCLAAEEIASPLRPLLAVASEHGLCFLAFLDRRAIAIELNTLRARFDAPIVLRANEHIRHLRSELRDYFEGPLERFEVPLDLRGSRFQGCVWSRLREVAFGETVTCSQIARQVGRPEAVRAVATANGQNPVALVVPCHRVLGEGGRLCGYGGGLWRKQWLLDHEREALRQGSEAQT